MKRPRWVTDQQRDTALANIHRRHDRDDVAFQHLLSEDPSEVLLYLRKLGTARLRGDEDTHDAEDAVTLAVWLQWQADDHEVWFLDAAEDHHLPRRRVGQILNVTTGQGLVDRRRLKRAAIRAARRAAPTEPPPPAARKPAAQEQWLADHAGQLRELAETLLAHRGLADDDADDWLAEVRADLADGGINRPAAFVALRCAVEAMAAAPDVGTLDDGHRLLAVLASWPDLDAGYAAAGLRSPVSTGLRDRETETTRPDRGGYPGTD